MILRLINFFFLSLLITTFLFVPSAFSESGRNPELEYAIKASLINNFTRFIEWPESAFPEGRQKLSICVVGKDPFGKSLDKIADVKKLKEREFIFKRFASHDEMEDCHILFISSSEKDHIEKILEKVKFKTTLVIGDTPEFAKKGVGINFFFRGKKIWFECNLDALRKSDLKVSSHMLALGRTIKGKKTFLAVNSAKIQDSM